MKKIVLTMFALLTMSAVIAQSDNAERKPRKQPTPEEMTARMTEQLNLTEEQQKKVLKLNKEYKDVLRGPKGPRHMGDGNHGPRPNAKTGETLKNQERPERPKLTEEQKAKFKEHQAKREEYDQKLKSILTEKQYKKHQKMHRRGHGKHHHGPRPE